MPDPLATVLRIRRVTVDEARRLLSAALSAEEQADRTAAAADAAIGVEGEIAADLMAGDSAVEAYAAWLPVGRAQAAHAWAASDHARSDVARARAALTVARAAAESADTMLRDRQKAVAVEVARRAQAEMDEIAGRVKEPVDP